MEKKSGPVPNTSYKHVYKYEEWLIVICAGW